ncbi:hypothetical protein [Streptomyces sp. NPDC058463]|uniref:hypothetical protein n=1 Tax=Streptomyces sp. NPDC058463 TaxID=3346510 RepID=UPI00366241BD
MRRQASSWTDGTSSRRPPGRPSSTGFARGWTVDEAQTENPVIPGVSLGSTRKAAQESPDFDGRLLCLPSVLVGGEHHFDFRAELGT